MKPTGVISCDVALTFTPKKSIEPRLIQFDVSITYKNRVKTKRENWGDRRDLNPVKFPPIQVSKTVQVSEPKLFHDRDFLYQKYVVEGLSTKEISALIFSSRTAVSTALKRFGIPLRDAKQKNRSQLRFGEAWRKHQVVVHRREQEIIEKMHKLRAQGFSYWKIADVFNSLGIRTKTGRGKWHARSVQKVMETTPPELADASVQH
ncbi:recombinase family protein [bacterium]|nr:recombinase family protein [bacterium]